ncbi:MAG: hypothetical protein K0S76_520 [Herbinix sp.]|nr:hypothetical protein [Herbinix sp.]
MDHNTLLNRERIIGHLKERLIPLPYVYAMWLEGADASGLVDEFSDLDIYVDFEDEYEMETKAAVEEALKELAEIDYKSVIPHGHPKLRQNIYHLSGTDEYQMIDFCFQLHSRDRQEYIYIKNNAVEGAMVLFDKDQIIRYKDFNAEEFQEQNTGRRMECKYRYSQHSRVLKYVYRKQYLEAYAYYNRYVLEPLIDLLRIIYTPANADYYLIHISHHIPAEERKRLEFFAQIASLEDIERKTKLAEEWFEKLVEKCEH